MDSKIFTTTLQFSNGKKNRIVECLTFTERQLQAGSH